MYRKKRKIENRVNEEILSNSIRIVNSDDFSPNDIISRQEALNFSRNNGIDLIEISKDNRGISICKLMEIGKFAYELKKKRKDIQKPKVLKEIRMTPVIGKNDLMVKKEKIKGFITSGNPVKISIFFKGRELYLLKDEGEKIILSIADEFSSISKISSFPHIEGKRMSATLSPKK